MMGFSCSFVMLAGVDVFRGMAWPRLCKKNLLLVRGIERNEAPRYG